MRILLTILLTIFTLLLGTTTSIYYLNPHNVKSKNLSERLIGGKIYRIPSRSMQETLVPGDLIVVARDAYQHKTPQRNDVIIFKSISNRDSKAPLIKRVIAISGDTVNINKGIVFVNNKKVIENYIHSKNRTSAYSLTMETRFIPIGKLFLLGDNRDNSNDSRMFGPISIDEVIGKATHLFYGENGRSGDRIK